MKNIYKIRILYFPKKQIFMYCDDFYYWIGYCSVPVSWFLFPVSGLKPSLNSWQDNTMVSILSSFFICVDFFFHKLKMFILKKMSNLSKTSRYRLTDTITQTHAHSNTHTHTHTHKHTHTNTCLQSNIEIIDETHRDDV